MTHTTRPEFLRSIQATLRADVARLDPDAQARWDEFFAFYNDLLYRFAHRLHCPEEAADDVVASVWLDLLKYLPRLDYDPARGGFRRWLYRVVRSKTVDELRRRGPIRRLPTVGHDTRFWRECVDPRSPDPQDELERVFDGEVARATLQRYFHDAPACEARVVRLCLVEGIAPSEASRTLGLQPAATRQALRRGRLRLRMLAADLLGVGAARGPTRPRQLFSEQSAHHANVPTDAQRLTEANRQRQARWASSGRPPD